MTYAGNICCVSIARTLHRRRDCTWWLRVTRPQIEVTNRARVIASCVLLPVIPCEQDLPEPVSLSDRKRPALGRFKRSRTRITQMHVWRSSVRSEVKSFGFFASRVRCWFRWPWMFPAISSSEGSGRSWRTPAQRHCHRRKCYCQQTSGPAWITHVRPPGGDIDHRGSYFHRFCFRQLLCHDIKYTKVIDIS